jgi:oxygen-independent coproporphyrinogen-3 oxidase
MTEGAVSASASLYIHVPFCASLCDYCDFYSVRADPADERFDPFVTTVLEDVEALLGDCGIDAVPTVYIGGGTPSALGAERMRRLLAGLAALLPSEPEECTVEANPESADGDFLRACREGGVTRISLGVQTFHGPSRRAVHRGGDPAAAAERLALAREIFGGGVSADLLTGLPLQDERALAADVERLLSFRPGHVSLYSLTVEEGTPLAARPCPAPPSIPPAPPSIPPAPPPRDEADRLWLRGRDLLLDAGYEQYEVSNFALPGRRSLHNIRYWRMENWIGAGPSASGTLIDDGRGTGRRYTADADVDRWLRRHPYPPRRHPYPLRRPPSIPPAPPSIPPAPPSIPLAPPQTVEHLDRSILIRESLLMGFRYLEGPDGALFRRRFGRDIEDLIPESLDRWRRRGVIRQDKPAPTGEGLLFLNPFLLDVFAELE